MKSKKSRGVSLEVDPETGELIAVADTEANEDIGTKFDRYGRLKNSNYAENEETKHKDSKPKEFIIHSKNKQMPAKKISLELGEEQYVDKNLQKIKELRQRLKNENIDYLAARQGTISNGLEEIGLSKEDMGKTGESSTGKITEKHKTIAKSQIEDAKMQCYKKNSSKEDKT